MPLIWPVELSAPEPDGYDISVVDVTTRSPVGEGFTRARPRAVRAPSTLKCNWVFTNNEAQLLYDMYTIALRQGAEAIQMPVWFAGQFYSQIVRFKGPPTFKYLSIFNVRAAAEFTIDDPIASSLWVELNLDNVDEEVTIHTFTSDFTLPRADIFIRTTPDSGTADAILMGWADDPDAIINLADAQLGGHIPITTIGAGAGGVDLGVLQTGGDLPRTLTARWEKTGTAPTQGDIVIIIPIRTA